MCSTSSLTTSSSSRSSPAPPAPATPRSGPRDSKPLVLEVRAACRPARRRERPRVVSPVAAKLCVPRRLDRHRGTGFRSPGAVDVSGWPPRSTPPARAGRLPDCVANPADLGRGEERGRASADVQGCHLLPQDRSVGVRALARRPRGTREISSPSNLEIEVAVGAGSRAKRDVNVHPERCGHGRHLPVDQRRECVVVGQIIDHLDAPALAPRKHPSPPPGGELINIDLVRGQEPCLVSQRP